MTEDSITHRVCSVCKSSKPLTDYWRHKDRPQERGYGCKDCRNRQRDEHRINGGVRSYKRLEKKVCPDCKIEKEAAEYYNANSRIDGLSCYCRSCVGVRQKAYRNRPDVATRRKEATRNYAKTERCKATRKTYNERVKSDPLLRERVRVVGRAYWHKSNLAKKRRVSKHGMSIDEFDALYIKQEKRCAICEKTLEERGACIDHCHSTGKVRGLLCANCNAGLGFFQDSQASLLSAVEYLRVAST